MASVRLVALVAFLIFLSLPPTLHSKGLQAQTFLKIFKLCKRCFGPLGTLLDIYDAINIVRGIAQPNDKSASSTEPESIGFYINFSVGNPTLPTTARLSISNPITILDRYELSYSSTHQCCSSNLLCSAENCNGDYLIEADGFTFENGHIENVPYMYVPGSGLQKPTGFLSLSRSSYSLQRTAQAEAFSYRFSDQDSNSYLTLGGGTSPIATTLQSTKILTNPSHRNLYYVNLTQISIGNNSYKIDPSTNSASMILDTVIGPTLLETAVYAQVKTELNKVRKNKKFTDKVNRLEICYKIKSGIFRYKRPRWPDLTLYFPSDPSNSSAGAEMVLTKMNYVVTVKKGRTKAECASIFETKGASVIGMMAQINREMVFDFSSSEPRLYFSQYP